MKTIEIYENAKTTDLKEMLKMYEDLLEENELIMDNNEECDDLKTISNDYEIDISLIRMELNKRLWENN